MENDNILVALFLGGWKHDKYFVIETPFFKSLGGCIFAPSELKFDTDWNWLMEVVEKVCLVCGYEVEIKTNSCYIQTINGSYSSTIQGENRIDATYKSIISFIKWYNEQLK